MTENETRWAIVGGGMLGVATAWKLIQRGETNVTLIEAGDQLGGLTSAWQLGDVRWDRFYHVTLLSDTKLREFLADMELEQEIEWVQTRTGFYSNGKLYSLSSSLEFLLFPVLNLYQKFRLGSTIFFGSKIKNWKALESIPVDVWLKKWSGRSTFEKIWLPLLKSKLGDAYQRVSAAFIWSYIDRMYKARRSGMKREMFGYVPGGYDRILETASRRMRESGATIRSNSPVTSIQQDATTGELKITYGRQQTATETFDRVILTIPSPAIDSALPALNEEERARLADVEYLGVVCTSLLLKEPLGGYYVTNVTDDWVPFTGIIEMGSIVKPEKLGGHYLVYLPQYVLADDAAFDESDDSIHERCITTLAKMYPHFDRSTVAAIQTAKARYVMALPTLNYSARRPPIACSVPGVYLLNSCQVTKGNLNVNEVIEMLDEHFDRDVWEKHLEIKHPPTSTSIDGMHAAEQHATTSSLD